MLRFISQDNPQFIVCQELLITTDQGETGFEPGDPISVSFYYDDLVIAEELVISDKKFQDLIISILHPAEFVIAEDVDGCEYVGNSLELNDNMLSRESIISRITRLNSLANSIKVTLVSI